MKLNSRVPVIALPYSEKHKAVPKELLIDYETGNIYVVSANDKSVIFDITSKILDKIDSISGNNIIIEIEGIGEINLSELLKEITLKLEDTVIISDVGKDIYIPKDERLDTVSLESKYKRIQIVGYETAENGMIPQKHDGKIRWIYPPRENDDNGGNGDTDQNPHDGLDTKVYPVEAVEGRIFLRASKRMYTRNLNKNATIVLPRTFDHFCQIFWKARTYSAIPHLKFSTSVLFNTHPYQPKDNAYHIYKFTTWDTGETWFGNVEVYNIDPVLDPPNNNINIEYLEKYYYSKAHIDENYSTDDELEKVFITRDQLVDVYVSKEQLEEGYFNKEKIEELLSWYMMGDQNSQIKLPKYILNKSK